MHGAVDCGANGAHMKIVSNAQGTIPLISSRIAGPLGVIHLPRLWLKARLKAAGRLPDAWNVGPDALFDATVCRELGLDAAETLAYLLREHPTYPAFEAWIRAKIGVPDAATLAKIRTALLERRPPWAAQRRAELGIDDPSVDTSALLNDLEEWSLVHDALAAEREA